jgi:hypothetical protein
MTTNSAFSALGAPQCHGLGAREPRAEELNVRRKRRSRPQHKVIAPLAETVEAQSRVWVSLPIARPTQTGQIERGLLSNLGNRAEPGPIRRILVIFEDELFCTVNGAYFAG